MMLSRKINKNHTSILNGRHKTISLSRSELGRLLGNVSLSQFQKKNPDTVAVDSWFLSSLSKEGFDEHFTMIQYSMYWSEGRIVDAGESFYKSIKNKKKRALLEKLFSGVFFSELGIFGIKKQNMNEFAQRQYLRYLQSLDSWPTLNDFKGLIEPNLEKISFEVFICSVMHQSRKGFEKLKGSLSASDMAILNILSLSDKKVINEYELFLDQHLFNVFNFEYCNHAHIRKFVPLSEVGSHPTVMGYLHGASRANFPTLDQLQSFSLSLTELDKLSSKEVKQMLRKHYGSNTRHRFMKCEQVRSLIESEEMSLYEAHRRIEPEVDVGLFYRGYQQWLKTSFNPWWRKTSELTM